MPVHNPDIEQLNLSIESTLNQTYSNLELIIIYKKNGKASDYEVERIFNENRDDHRIRIIQNNCGFVEALNLGIEMSNGTKIGRIDADDFSASTRFEEQMEFMKENNASLIGSWAYSVSHEGKIIGTIEPPYESKEIRKTIMRHCPFLHPSLLIEKRMLNEVGRYDVNFNGGEDYELYFRAISKNFILLNIPKHLIYLRETNSSRSRGNQWRSQRRTYLKTKNTALIRYGFNRYYDIFYYMLTPMTLFISPKHAYKIKSAFGWNKKITNSTE